MAKAPPSGQNNRALAWSLAVCICTAHDCRGGRSLQLEELNALLLGLLAACGAQVDFPVEDEEVRHG